MAEDLALQERPEKPAEKPAEKPKKRTRRDIAELHKQEWEDQRKLLADAVDKGSAAKARFAKLAAEALKLRQEGERKAWQPDRPAPARDKTQDTNTKGGKGHDKRLTRIEHVIIDAPNRHP